MQFYGQAAQDFFVLTMLKNKMNGTFLEIGSNHPICINNTYLLEKNYKWRGIMVEYNNSFLELYKRERPNSKHIIADATSINFKSEFESINMPLNIDYLQIDLEVTNNSTLQTLMNLEQQVMNKYRFSVITFEHDVYSGNYFDTRNKSREIFLRNGYFRVFSDVSHVGNPYEDWYVDPQSLNIDMDFVNNITSEKSLGWTEIIPKLWKPYLTFPKQIDLLNHLPSQQIPKIQQVHQTPQIQQVQHVHRIEQIPQTKRYVVFDCENEHLFHCGLGDRLQGLLCAIVLSDILDRELLINWVTPDIHSFFDFSKFEYAKNIISSQNVLTIDAGGDQKKQASFFQNPKVMSILNEHNVIKFICNTNPLIYLFMNKSIFPINKSSETLTELDYNTLFDKAAKQLFTKYLIPIGNLDKIVKEYDSKFNLNNGHVTGIQIRTGDTFFNKKAQPFYPINDKCQGMINIIKEHIENNQNNHNDSKLFMTFDNPAVSSMITNSFPNKEIFYVDYPIGHFGLQRSENELLKQFADLILLSKCHTLFISHFSNFGRIPFMVNESQNKYAIGIQSNIDEYGNTIGLGKNDSSMVFKIYKPSLLDISCKHPDWKLLNTQLNSQNMGVEGAKISPSTHKVRTIGGSAQQIYMTYQMPNVSLSF